MRLPPDKITAWVCNHFPDHKTRKDGTEILINNPFTYDDDYHFNISITKGVCHDWRGDFWAKLNPATGKHRTGFLSFVRLVLNCSYQAAVNSVLGQTTRYSDYLREEVILEEPDAIDLPTGSIPILQSPFKKIAKMALNWLASRGIIKEDIREYNIHHTGTNIVWPYYEYGVLVYWQLRSVIDKRFLFPTSDEADKDCFYGFDQAEPARHVVITEAIIDAISIKDQALASGGAILTPKQVQKLRLLDPADGIILAPDNDEPGIQSLFYNIDLLWALKYKIYYSIPPKVEYAPGKFTKDWNDILLQTCGRDRAQVNKVLEQGVQVATRDNLVRLYL